jgi:hypothetical protein
LTQIKGESSGLACFQEFSRCASGRTRRRCLRQRRHEFRPAFCEQHPCSDILPGLRCLSSLDPDEEKPMLRKVIVLGLLACVPASSAADPFPKGDPSIGKKLYLEQNCARCHSEQFGGDGSKIYLRSDRRVTSPEKLRAQVRFCSTQLDTHWFPEEEEHVAAFLNQQYYKFK